jgi:thiol-disulfide isomerase/thioredoxin
MRKWFIIPALIMLASVCQCIAFAQEQPRTARAQGLFEQANNALAKGDFDAAISAIEEALKVEPDWAELHLKLGIACLFKFVRTRDAAFEARARASLTRASELNPKLAAPYQYLGIHYSAKREYEQAVRYYEKAISADPSDTSFYTAKWDAQLRKPDFEREIPLIRGEIESLVARTLNEKKLRPNALLAAAKGYSLIGDDEGRYKMEKFFEAEFPEREELLQILFPRAVSEKNKERQADLLEDLFARFPATRQWPFYSMAFRARAVQQNVSGEKLLGLGRAWVDSSGQDHYQKISSLATVIAVLAERKTNLEQADALADEAVKIVDTLAEDSVLGPGAGKEDKDRYINFLKELAHRSKGFVLLRKGKTDEAARELNSSLQPVIKEVEKNGFILWKDMDLREIGVRPRVLWLAEMYEAQGDLERAAKYLLAGFGDDELANKYIRERSLAVFKKLGRSNEAASTALSEAERRYQAMTIPTANRKDEEKKSLLANRINLPAPDFQVTALDKRVIRLSELKGKVVVLNFWATWCGPCVVEMPHFQRTARKYTGNPKVVFIAISIDENRALVGPFLKRIGYTDLVAYDGGAARSYQIASIPTTLIIDRDTVIQYRDVGFGGAGETYIERLSWRIDELLKEKADAATPGK